MVDRRCCDCPYLALTSVSAFIRLLPTSDTDKDIEILTLRCRYCTDHDLA
jgi:hypothetical protein